MFSSLLLFLSLNQAEGAKTVWVNSYTRSDGTSVQGHFRSPPSDGGMPLTGHTPVVAYSSQDPKGSSTAESLRFQRGFVDGNAYVRLVHKHDGSSIELYCVKTAEGVIENVDLEYYNGLVQKEGVIVSDYERLSLEDVDVWIGSGVDYWISSDLSVWQMVHYWDSPYNESNVATLYGIQGSVEGHVFNFPTIKSKTVTEFHKGCEYLKGH